MRLEDELKAVGSDMSADDFRAALNDLLFDLCPSWSVESLLCHWRDAGHFCALFRLRHNLEETADDLILRTLLNQRKKGELSLRDRAG